MLKSRIGYGLFLFSAIAFYLFYSKFVAVVILVSAIAVPVIVFIPTIISLLRLKVEFVSETIMAQNGDESEIEILVDNPTIVALKKIKLVVETRGIYSSEKIKQKYFFSVGKREQKKVLLKLKSEHCTRVTVKIKSVCGFEPLGVLSFFKRIKASLNVYVVPKISSFGEKINPSSLPDDEGSRYSIYKKGEDYAQTFDYHIYHDGDKIKHINWKLSGKQDELMVREGSFPLSSRACILVEPNSIKDLNSFDNMLSKAASVSNTLIENEVPHDMVFFYEKDECSRFVSIMDISDFYYGITMLYENSVAVLNQSDCRVLSEFLSTPTTLTYAKIFYITNVINENTSDNLMMLGKSSDISVFITENGGELSAVIESDNIEVVRI